jgi:DNA-directed RNA polymerase subunit beta'
LVERQYTSNIKTAKRMIERMRPEVWDALEEVISEHPVLLNRAPTLHRLGIQAFEPRLVDGKAIQLHPLVCVAFNADFDGDQMAVHIPLSAHAQAEARVLMLATHNLFSPANGNPIVAPAQDIVLGGYFLTMEKGGEPRHVPFASAEDALQAYNNGLLDLHEFIDVRLPDVSDGGALKLQRITAGRLLFNEIVPPELRYVNRTMDKKSLTALVAQTHDELGDERTIQLLDDMKAQGFHWAAKAGITFSLTDMKSPEARARILHETERRARLEKAARPAVRDARPDERPVRQHHRGPAGQVQLPRRLERSRILRDHARRAQGPCRHCPANGRRGLSHPAPG